MEKTLVEVYSEYISKQANDLKYAGQPLVEETDVEPNQREHLKKMRDDHFAKVDAARDHWNKHVNPSFKKHGLSPKFADAVNKHVKLHGDEEVIKNHGQYGSHPDWFDRKTQKVKKLKPVYVVDKSVGGAINPDF